MKAITIKQPWATLIALGEKQYETRSWYTKYRGKMAIHAGKSVVKKACQLPEIKKALKKHSIDQLPTGAVIAIVELTDCFKVIKDYHDKAETTGGSIDMNEYPFGDYSEGRFAWKLDNVKILSPYILAKGKLGLWEWDEE